MDHQRLVLEGSGSNVRLAQVHTIVLGPACPMQHLQHCTMFNMYNCSSMQLADLK